MPQSASIDRLARAVSILGHPLLALPAALMLPAALRGGDPRTLQAAFAGFALFAGFVMGWSWWQVRRGRWAHVDASQQSERRSLNRTLLVLLGLGALLAWRALPSPDPALALALSAGIVAVAMSTVRWCKLSLHIAFAVYATGLLWPLGPMAIALCCVFAAGIAWSRLRLSRHRPRDLVAGAAAGLLAAIVYWLALPMLRVSA
jgi:membrane-associated phospholipid phosphatase